MALREHFVGLALVAACLSALPAQASWLHRHGGEQPAAAGLPGFDQDVGSGTTTSFKPGKLVLKTASNKKLKVKQSAMHMPKWNRFSRQSRYMHRLEKASKQSGYATVSKPAFSNSMWSPKMPKVAHTFKLHMPHMPHRNGQPARMKTATKQHWLW